MTVRFNADAEQRLPSGLVTGRRCPSRLRDFLASGYPILLDARYSTSSGKRAYAAAVQNLKVAVQQTAENELFPNLPDLLPPKSELVRRLQESTEVIRSHDPNGRPFENRFVVLQAPDCPTVWLHLSAGSGRKIDEQTWHQPVALHAAQLIARIKPAIVVAAEVSRWTRAPTALGPWFEAQLRLDDTLNGPPYICRRRGSAEELTTTVILSIFEEALSAGAESREMRDRSTTALRAKVPLPDEGGFALYPFSQPPPPPLATAWRSDGSGGRGEQIAFIDCPMVRKRLTKITYGLPEVYEADGETPVDQLALVRDFLAHRGLPDWSPMRLAQHLADLGLSTEGLRRQRGSRAARWGDRPLTRSDCWRIIHSLEAALEFYRTGELWRRVGDGGAPVLATRLAPPDGGDYVSAADYARVRSQIDANQIAFTRAHHWTFGHLPARFGDTDCYFVAEIKADGVRYRLRATSGGAGRAPGVAPIIPAQAFADSLVQGLLDHGQNLTPFVAPPTAEPTDAEHRQAALSAGLAIKRRRRERLYQEIFPSDGVPRLRGALLRDANEDYNRLVADIDADTRALAAATLLAEQARAKQDPRRMAVTSLMQALLCLRDPQDLTYQAAWRGSITDLTVGATQHPGPQGPTVRTWWKGQLLLGQGTDAVAVPFKGTSTRPLRRRRLDESPVTQDLRAGRPLPGGPLSEQSPSRRRWLREALGVPLGPVPLLTVRDPRLLRIGMAVLFPPLPRAAATGDGPAVADPLTIRQLPAAARRLGEPLALIKRVAAVTGHHDHVPEAQRPWQTPGDRAVADLYRDLTAAGGTLHRSDYSADRWAELRHAAKRCPPASMWTYPRGAIAIKPCPWCEAVAPVLLTIREATEPVCGNCRLDLTGIKWPAKPYDRYRCRPSRTGRRSR